MTLRSADRGVGRWTSRSRRGGRWSQGGVTEVGRRGDLARRERFSRQYAGNDVGRSSALVLEAATVPPPAVRVATHVEDRRGKDGRRGAAAASARRGRIGPSPERMCRDVAQGTRARRASRVITFATGRRHRGDRRAAPETPRLRRARRVSASALPGGLARGCAPSRVAPRPQARRAARVTGKDRTHQTSPKAIPKKELERPSLGNGPVNAPRETTTS